MFNTYNLCMTLLCRKQENDVMQGNVHFRDSIASFSELINLFKLTCFKHNYVSRSILLRRTCHGISPTTTVVLSIGRYIRHGLDVFASF